MKIGLYFVYVKSEISLCPIDLIRTLSQKNIHIFLPNWIEHKGLLKDFKDIEYLNNTDFFNLDHFFIFCDENVLLSPMFMKKNICFVIQQLEKDFPNFISKTFNAISTVKNMLPNNQASILSTLHKELHPPFNNLFSVPKTKYRNCYIINDSLLHTLNNYEFDPNIDIAISYSAHEQQKITFTDSANILVSPTNLNSSFSQALLAENIYFEPDVYDLFIFSIALKELAYTSKTYRTHNPTLKKLKLFSH